MSGVGEYGVGVGSFVAVTRDKVDDFGHYFHGHVRISFATAENLLFEAAVDVNKPDGGIQYCYFVNLDPALLKTGATLTDGYHRLAKTSSSGALDSSRVPLGDHPTTTRAPSKLSPMIWTQNVGTTALKKLEGLFLGREGEVKSVRLYGAAYAHATGQTPGGVHDVHCNQGDPPGPFQHLDGIWQDGGVVVEYRDGHWEGFFVKFTTQTLDTDDAGHPNAVVKVE